MQQITYDQFKTLKLTQPLKLSFDEYETVSGIQRNGNACNDWLALPIEWGISLPGTEYTSRLQQYCAKQKIKEFVGFSPMFIGFDSRSEIIVAESLAINFFKFESLYALRAYTILPETSSFQLVSDGDYYSVFIGPPDFLTFVMGVNAQEAIQQFKLYVASYKSDAFKREHLGQVLIACEKFNSE